MSVHTPETALQLVGENINLLSESEWRMIHNGLSTYQNQSRLTNDERYAIQQLMDKIRDNYIDIGQSADTL